MTAIIVAPHPDDEWIGCGNILLRERANNNIVKVLMVTARVVSRVDHCSLLAKKYGVVLKILGEKEKKIDEKRLADFLTKEVKNTDNVYIPTFDSHPDHQVVHRVCREVLTKSSLFEYGIYNNSRNLFRRSWNKLKSLIVGRGFPSFLRASGQYVSFDNKKKADHIRELEEFPRGADLIRPITSLTGLNIAFLTKDYPVGTVDAGFTSILRLAKELKKKGHYPYLIQNREFVPEYEAPANKKIELFEGIPIYRPYGFKWGERRMSYVNPAGLFNRFIAPALGAHYVQRKLKIKFDVLHGSSSASFLVIPTLIAKLFCRRAKMFHTIRSESFSALWGWKTSKLLNRVERVFLPLESLKKKLLADGCKEEKIVLSRSSIDVKAFSRVSVSKELLRKKYAVAHDEKVVLYYGKGGHFKGVEVLLDAINHIPKEENVQFLLFHPVVWLPHITKAAKEHTFKEKVQLRVDKIDVPSMLNLADLAVFPFRSIKGTEGNPLCVLETMASKTPIVTSELDDLKEIVEKDKDVLMATPEDAASLAKEIMRALKDEKLRESIAKNAFEKVQSFDNALTTENYLKEYYISLVKP